MAAAQRTLVADLNRIAMFGRRPVVYTCNVFWTYVQAIGMN